MKGLILRLSALDSDAEAALKVIDYFDALSASGAGPGALTRSAAALAECPAGMRAPAGGPAFRFRPDGTPLDGRPAPTRAVSLGPRGPDGADSAGGEVWLERDAPARPLDDLLLERFAIAARLCDARRGGTPPPHLADPALVELALTDRESVEDRTRALRLLGIDLDTPLRVVAVAAGDHGASAEAVGLVTSSSRIRVARITEIDAVAVVLVQPRESRSAFVADLRRTLHDRAAERGTGEDLPRVGVGDPHPPLHARLSWLQARTALRFAVQGSPDESLVDHGSLGSIALLSEVPTARLRQTSDVVALHALGRTASGAQDLAVLAAFCRTGSLRQAAALVHLHHSSVAARLAHVETALGIDLDQPHGRFRASTALIACRLLDTAPDTADG